MSERAASVAAWEALFRAQVAVLRELNAEFPSDEISFTEYDVLFNLSRWPGRRLRIRDLNKHLLLSQPSVSRLVDRLAARGLVSKESDPGDGRGTVAHLTDAGYELFLSVAVQHADSIQRRVGSSLSSDELETLTQLCDKLRNGGAPS
ncbi:DNA-binding MarR family transcriptional regulator [Microbacteriaceae bacterium SG_E_30_P1]|uniref:DNA-binding MarR family transcriptional regulator n=1 Tax=Antiquaquibacter oligotrophicus TaxID=2880260 RepID=A0ABT6KSN9_9MICO|nr:MarR family transcriptional regulator [Antiquaquibacter oligotrophicus]MDH6182067.1 DNA-binding MarR family transcriptional regulator [Antiquaquibacter oligotrophicus]UDF12266.1 MarR family transcriptional regulator [Antiquaquibacter oligotrophicus]